MEGGEGASFPDTATCIATPTITFPEDVTVSQTYLAIIKCSDINAISGDFVTVYTQTADGQPVQSISQFETTDAGVEWVTPLADSNGVAWTYVQINPGNFDCNSTGIPYSLEVNWDGQTASNNFLVTCPEVTITDYREEIPYTEPIRAKARVRGNDNRPLAGILCQTTVLEIGTDQNTTIKQRQEAETNESGVVDIEFATGFLNTLLIGYDYVLKVECLNGDANYTFSIVQTSEQYFKNPLYYTIVFLSDNILSILVLLIVAALIIGILFMRVYKTKNS